MLVFYDFIIAHQFNIYNSVNESFYQPDYEQGQEEVDCLFILQQKFYNLFIEVLYLSKI